MPPPLYPPPPSHLLVPPSTIVIRLLWASCVGHCRYLHMTPSVASWRHFPSRFDTSLASITANSHGIINSYFKLSYRYWQRICPDIYLLLICSWRLPSHFPSLIDRILQPALSSSLEHPSFHCSLPQSVNHANKLVMNIMYVWAWTGRGRGKGKGVLLLRMFGTHSQCEMARPSTRFRLPEGNICPCTRVQARSWRGGGNPCENKTVSEAAWEADTLYAFGCFGVTF